MAHGLNGKHALVTGGSRGIGRAIVLALAGEGASVCAVHSRESDDVAELRSLLEEVPADSYTAQADVTDEASVEELIAGIRERFGTLEVVVNNAGVVSHIPVDKLELDEWRRVLDTNLTGAYLVARHALELMSEGGSIINIGSSVALRGMVGRAHYGASKAGMIGLTRALCKELGPRGIRVNAIAPGIILTHQAAGLTEEGRVRYAKLTALDRLGEPEEIAGPTLFLAGEDSRYVSGVTLNVDGGI